ncbi:MAG: circularly permuted type 2 ATP-grasp protein [Chloroflexi bacterium]|nr:circularly permuted type 2 ATP-grasp protein [Chloroflexota bacterium]
MVSLRVNGPVSANNECLDETGAARAPYEALWSSIDRMGIEAFCARGAAANNRVTGDSFTFLLDPKQFRPTPTDLLPRIIAKNDWKTVEAGVGQRQRALNMFLVDLYCGTQDVVPSDVIFSCNHFY